MGLGYVLLVAIVEVVRWWVMAVVWRWCDGEGCVDGGNGE